MPFYNEHANHHKRYDFTFNVFLYAKRRKYEVWNVNLHFGVGGRTPHPARFCEIIQIPYFAI